jgi:hypothetical protein
MIPAEEKRGASFRPQKPMENGSFACSAKRAGANRPMCFSATANFVGSAALATIGVITLTRVKHRRELLFAALPTLFAVHQFIEGFVWLGLDGILSPKVTHNMGAAFMLYAQGLLPFLLPLSVLLFEPDKTSRMRMRPSSSSAPLRRCISSGRCAPIQLRSSSAATASSISTPPPTTLSSPSSTSSRPAVRSCSQRSRTW